MVKDAGAAPLSDAFHLDVVILGLAGDLAALRAGEISVDDARARAELAKQVFNGVRLIINARRSIESGARLIGGADHG